MGHLGRKNIEPTMLFSSSSLQDLCFQKHFSEVIGGSIKKG